jgi:hypothetical protein
MTTRPKPLANRASVEAKLFMGCAQTFQPAEAAGYM